MTAIRDRNLPSQSVSRTPSEIVGQVWTTGLTASVVIVFALISIQYGLAPVSFDGAMNLQVAQALVDGNGYARFYESWRLLPEEVQTNAPYVFPASAVFGLLGVTPFSAQLVSLIYAGLFSLVVFWLIRPAAGPRWALLAVLLTLTVSDFGRFALNGYGEVPALFWCLLGIGLGLRAFETEKPILWLLAGCCFGLSILTKTVMLMPVGVSVALLAIAGLAGKDRRGVVALILALAAVVAGFECWRLMVLGDFVTWTTWWADQLAAVSAQAGVSDGFQDTNGLLEKIAAHADAFSRSVHLSFPSIYGLLAMPLIGCFFVGHALIFRSVQRSTVLLISILLAICLAYFVWWLAITPTQKAWYRRIFNGWLVFSMLTPLMMAYAFKLKSALLRGFSIAVLIPPLALLLWSAIQSVSLKSNEVRNSGVASAAEYIASLPEDSRFYGFGWYSAPVMALYADVKVYDLTQNKFRLQELGRHHYLLSDANLLQSGHQEMALEGLRAELVHDGGPWARIYQLQPEYAFPDSGLANLGEPLQSVDFGTTSYAMAQGLYPPDGVGWKWARHNARVRLRFDTLATSLFVRGAISEFDEMVMGDESAFRLEIQIGGCRLPPLVLEQGGSFNYHASVEGCNFSEEDQVWVEFKANAVRQNSYRLLSWRLDSLGLGRVSVDNKATSHID